MAKTRPRRPPDPRFAGSARALAIEVLRRVDTGEAYADLALNAALEKSKLDPRDRAFATDLVYGTLRWRGRIDHVLEARAPRGLAKLPSDALSALRLGAYQILFSRSVPARAAVDETVRAIRAFGHEGLTAFANALLRRLSRERDDLLYPDPARDPVGHAAAFHAHPPWIVERIFALLGESEGVAFLEADNLLPPLTLRANLARVTRDALIERLGAAGHRASPGSFAPGAVILDERAPPAALPGFAEGLFAVQDEASQLVPLLTGARPGERVLDLCAAPGGKTAELARMVGPEGRVIAVDSHAKRLALVGELAARLGVLNVKLVRGDARRLPPEVREGKFDRVLVDAPCTGLGVLRRNPDARWRAEPEAPARLAELQREILGAAIDLARPGGTIVYSVCTWTREESEDVIEQCLAGRAGVVLEGAGDALGAARPEVIAPGPGGDVLRTWPHRHGMDGFFAARLGVE